MAEEDEFAGAIGIDLGTTYSCVAVYVKDKVEIIPNDQGNRTTPSYVAFTDEEKLVGDAAKNQIIKNPTNTVYDAKRLIGRSFKDREVQSDLKTWPFSVVPDDSGNAAVSLQLRGREEKMRPEQISGFLLEKLKQTAESYLGKKVRRAVITVPAYFNDAQRSSTKVAGQLAGLDVKRIINEPTAAALAYGFGTAEGSSASSSSSSSSSAPKTVLVFDLGGGTFDVSLIRLEGSVVEVKATAGNTHLGGQDFDNNLTQYCMQEFKKKTGVDITDDAKAIRRLRSACERAKRALSSSTTTEVEIDSLSQGQDLSMSVTRAKFEQLNKAQFEECLRCVEKVLEDSKLERGAVDEIVMVGGSSRIPKVQEMVSEFFAGKALNHSINPDEAVAYGAAIQATVLCGTLATKEKMDILLLDVTPLSIGLDVDGGVYEVLIPRNSTIPRKKSKVFTTSDDYQTVVQIDVYEGERPRAKANHLLGSFDLTGIRRARAGRANIEVTFDIDSNGVLTVSAVDQDVGAKGNLAITNTSRLSQAEVERMREEAARYAKEDAEFAKKVRLRNRLEKYAYFVAEQAAKPGVPETLRATAQEHVQWAEEKAEAASVEELEKRMEMLTTCHETVSAALEEGGEESGDSDEGSGDDDSDGEKKKKAKKKHGKEEKAKKKETSEPSKSSPSKKKPGHLESKENGEGRPQEKDKDKERHKESKKKDKHRDGEKDPEGGKDRDKEHRHKEKKEKKHNENAEKKDKDRVDGEKKREGHKEKDGEKRERPPSTQGVEDGGAGSTGGGGDEPKEKKSKKEKDDNKKDKEKHKDKDRAEKHKDKHKDKGSKEHPKEKKHSQEPSAERGPPEDKEEELKGSSQPKEPKRQKIVLDDDH